MENHLSTHSVGDLVSVVVVSCRCGDLLAECLASIRWQTHRNLEVFVLLNNADSRTAEKWGKDYPEMSFDFYPDNRLYCGPQNEGIRRSKGPFVLCLNDDVVLTPAYIQKAVEAMGKDEKIGSVSGCLLRDDGLTADSLGFEWSRSRKPIDRGYGRPIGPQQAASGAVFGVNGAVAFYRKKMLEAIKIDAEYFDESYGIYYEDFDLAWRARNAGWGAYYCAEAVATHKRGASTRRFPVHRFRFLNKIAFANIPDDLKTRHIRNRYATIIKNDSWKRILPDFPWIFFYEARLLVYLLFFDVKIIGEFFRDLGFIRRALQKRRKILDSFHVR
jgi:GT2 family glycosyltransferase